MEEQHPIPDDIKVPDNVNDAMFLTSAISADSPRKASVVNSEAIATGRGNDSLSLTCPNGKTSIGLRKFEKVQGVLHSISGNVH
jgi:hypothetical protein